MKTEIRRLGKTYITRSFPWGLNHRSGHRLLCSDGKIRAAELAETADTFFSTPAKVRIAGRWISGYMTVESEDGASTGEPSAFSFRHHTCHGDILPAWPASFTPERVALIKLSHP